MRIVIVTPAPLGSTKGNRITAERWADLLRRLGHDVHVSDQLPCEEDDDFICLIALHATRSHDALAQFIKRRSGRLAIVCLTGTDLHLDWRGLRGESAQRQAEASMRQCDRLVVLEPQMAAALPDDLKDKTHIVLQSAKPVADPDSPLPNSFEVCVVGHLRDEKDPLLTARAVRLLPPDSKIKVTHVGAALNVDMQRAARAEMAINPRYHWLGELSHEDAQRHLARSHLMVLSSKIEGAPSAISEAAVNGVPILATRISATLGLLGREYPGLFPVGDEAALAELLLRAETRPTFLSELTRATKIIAQKFSEEAELEAIQRLLE